MRIWLIIIVCFLSIISTAKSLEYAFIENKGQWSDSCIFYAKTPSLNVWVSRDGLILQNQNSSVKMQFVSSDFSNVQVGDLALAKYSYFKGALNTAANISSYKNLIIKNIYPNIDLSLKIEGDKFSYNFILNPTANPKNIQIKFIGQDSLLLGNNGDANIKVGDLNIINQKPFSYQSVKNKTQKINSKFEINSDKLLSFQIENFDATATAVIDPLVYSTLYGGSGYDYAVAITVDKSNRPVIAGYSYSDDFPTTFGVNSRATLKMPDVFVAKFSEDCSTLIFSTFIGSASDDYAQAMVLDANDNIYVTGYTGYAKSFPIVGDVYDSTHNGGYDAFLFKLNSSGNKIIYSTLIGGDKDDYSIGLALDAQNNAYITGYTTDSSSYPISDSTQRAARNNGGTNCFISKFDANGKYLLYSSIFGGSDDDFAQSVAVNSQGEAYVVGTTFSRNFPVYNSFNTHYSDSISSQNSESFISKFSNDGSAMLSSAFLGGESKDGAYSVCVRDSVVYFCGSTQSKTFPIAGPAYQSIYKDTNVSKGVGDAFFAKASYGLDSLYLSSLFGGSATERAFGITLDSSKNIYLTGFTGSRDFPTVKYSYDTTYNDSLYTDAFVSKFTPAGDSLLYSTYIGGKLSDVGKSIAIDNKNMPIICGFTQSNPFPTTSGAFQRKRADSVYDAFISKVTGYPFAIFVDFSGATVDTTNGSSTIYICDNAAFKMTISTIGTPTKTSVLISPKKYLISDTAFSQTISPDSNITYFITLSDANGVSLRDTISVVVSSRTNPQIVGSDTLVFLNTISSYQPQTIRAGAKYQWTAVGGEILGADTNTTVVIKWSQSGYHYLKLKEINGSNCADSAIISVVVSAQESPKIKYIGSTNICLGHTIVLDAGAGFSSYKWSTGETTQTIGVSVFGKYFCTVRDPNGIIGKTDTVKITVYTALSQPYVYYENKMLKCSTSALYYQWFMNNVRVPGEIDSFMTPTKSGTYYIEIYDSDSCKAISNLLFVSMTGVEDGINNSKFSIYPNPFDNSFEFVNKEKLSAKIVMYNLLGEIVFASDLYDDKRIDLSSAPSGVYFICVDIDGARTIEKLIKK